MSEASSIFNDGEGATPVLREYLYVDVPMVRGILSQLEAGIDDSESVEDDSKKRLQMGVKNLVEGSKEWGGVHGISRSLAEFHFPQLEYLLEEIQYLEDFSEFLNTDDNCLESSVESVLPPGRIVRITAPGHLMDSRFIASMLTGFSVTARGLANMGILDKAGASPSPAAKQPKGAASGKKGGYRALPLEDEELEGKIPLGIIPMPDDSGQPISGEFLRGIVQVLRGMYAPGLHLMLTPAIEEYGTISVRLQDGRQYLDTDPDILFSRYGVSEQLWTVVGVVGHHAEQVSEMGKEDFVRDDGSIDRSRFAKYVTRLGALLGSAGLTDIAQTPGFTIVPWAIYRNLAEV